jgi:hypothetical protein
VIEYKNSFLPIIEISIVERRLEGAVVTIALRLAIPVMLFMLVWLGGAGFGGMVLLGAGIGEGDAAHALFGVLFPLSGFGLMGLAFAFEARRAEAQLREMFPEATPLPAEPTPPKEPYR